MNKEIYDLYLKMGLSEKVLKMAEEAENGLKERFKQIDAIAEYNQLKYFTPCKKPGKRGTPGNLYRIRL